MSYVKSASCESSVSNGSILTPAEIEYFDIKALRIQHSLISFSSSRHFREDSVVQNICSIVVPVFFVQNQFTLARRNMVVESLNVQLWEAFSQLDLEWYWEFYPDLLIWAFMFGVYISVGQPKRPWFLSKMARRTRDRFSWRWEECREVLRGFYYFDRVYEVEFKSICEEVRTLMNYVTPP